MSRNRKQPQRNWLKVLPTAILVLFLLGFPCRSMMLYLQAPAHDCCEDSQKTPQTPSQGCKTLCAASAVRIVVQSSDDAMTGVPADAVAVDLIASDLLFPSQSVVEPTVSLPIGSPPLYLQNASLLI